MEIRWYVVDLLFARVPEQAGAVFCESSSVLFEGPSADKVYDRALQWASRQIEDTDFELVGVQHIHLLDDAPDDGVEVAGRFFDDDPWGRREELIPPREEIQIIVFEASPDTPIGELIDEPTVGKLRRFFLTGDRPDEQN